MTPSKPANNASFNAVPRKRYVLLEAGHRIWEEAPSDYADHLIAWIDGDHNLDEERPPGPTRERSTMS